jgi:hypothetical protein
MHTRIVEPEVLENDPGQHQLQVRASPDVAKQQTVGLGQQGLRNTYAHVLFSSDDAEHAGGRC